jgi:hypothetical protein
MIKTEDIANYRREWTEHILELVPTSLLVQKSAVKRLFKSVFDNYLSASRTAIVEYILNSPDERKRLDITILP